MFHICIENVSKKYYFSEKLIGCFLCKSIPVYFGCTNISDYFDTKGMFIVDNLESLLYTCNNLTEKDYIDKESYIEHNYNEALKWIDYPKRLNDKILSLNLKK